MSGSAGVIHIGGACTKAKALELIEELRLAGVGFDYSESLPLKLTPKGLLKRLNADGYLTLMDSEATGGMFEDLESWLEDSGLPFDRHSDAYYDEWDAEWHHSRPGQPSVSTPSNGSKGRLCDADDVIRALEALHQGNVHAALDALHQAVGQLRTVSPLPPFAIVD